LTFDILLTEDLCIVQKEELSLTCYTRVCTIPTLDERPIIFIRDKPTLWPKRVLHKDYDRNGTVEKKVSGREIPGT
jgi:hypothetical protein